MKYTWGRVHSAGTDITHAYGEILVHEDVGLWRRAYDGGFVWTLHRYRTARQTLARCIVVVLAR